MIAFSPTVASIKREVSAYFGIPEREMTSRCRLRMVARPRQVAMYFAKERTHLSPAAIARHFGHRDRTTVLHAVRQVKRLEAEDRSIAAAVATLGGRL